MASSSPLPARRLLTLPLLAALAFLLLPARRARGDELTPGLETQELRQRARAALDALVVGLAPEDRRKVVGLYVAFDPTASDAVALAACDDDGDPVVVVSDGLLRVLDTVASAAAHDDARGSRRVEGYASLLAASQLPGRRLLPPPLGFYPEGEPAPERGGRLAGALSFVLARELAHHRAGDVACPRPTPTREHGDDAWTDAEQRAARETARALYAPAAAGRDDARDAEAASHVLAAGLALEGALAWLRFSRLLEDARPRAPLSALVTHPRSAARLEVVARAATRARAAPH